MSKKSDHQPQYTIIDSKTGIPVDLLTPEQMDDLEFRLIHGWAWCTDNEDIMKVLHFWIGGGRDDKPGKNNYRTINHPFFIISDTDPNRMVTFWEDGNGSAQLNKGEQHSYFDTPFDEKSTTNRRGSVLEAFARIEFILDHLSLIQLGVYSDVGNPTFALSTIRSQNAQRKIRDLQKIKSLKNVDFKAIERIRNLRNQMAHQYFVEVIDYKGIHLSRRDGSGQEITNALNEDYTSAIKTLFDAYFIQQEQVVQWLLGQFKKMPPKRLKVEKVYK